MLNFKKACTASYQRAWFDYRYVQKNNLDGQATLTDFFLCLIPELMHFLECQVVDQST
jgi:hypothetical protein